MGKSSAWVSLGQQDSGEVWSLGLGWSGNVGMELSSPLQSPAGQWESLVSRIGLVWEAHQPFDREVGLVKMSLSKSVTQKDR